MMWENKTLGDVSISIQTGPFGSQLHQSDYSESGIPVVMPKDLVGGKIVTDSIARVPTIHVERLSQHKIIPNDILYSRRGDVGRCAFATEEEAGWLCGTGCLRVTIDKCKVNPKFVFYQLQTSGSIGWVEKHAVGSTMLNLNTSILSHVPIILPNKKIQDKIADILSAYDDLIENNQKQIKLLEEAAQRLYKEWFVDFRFPGHETTPIIDGLPEGWERKKLVEFANVVMGQSPKSEYYNSNKKGLPFHQGVGSYGNRFVIDDIYSSSFTRIAEANSILFSVRAPVGRLNITNNRIVIGRGLAAINHKEGLQHYLFYLLKDTFFKDNIIGNGSIFASISKDELLELSFVIPNKKLILTFEKIALSYDEKIKGLDKKSTLLIESRDRLLPKLMGGEMKL